MKGRAAVVVLALGFIALGAAAAAACEMSFSLIDSGGAARTVTPGREVPLVRGEIYRLEVTLKRTTAGARSTRRRPSSCSRSGLPLVLLRDPAWRDLSSREHVTELKFKAAEAGTWELEVVRDCTKAGYDEILKLKVQDVPGPGAPRRA